MDTIIEPQLPITIRPDHYQWTCNRDYRKPLTAADYAHINAGALIMLPYLARQWLPDGCTIILDRIKYWTAKDPRRSGPVNWIIMISLHTGLWITAPGLGVPYAAGRLTGTTPVHLRAYLKHADDPYSTVYSRKTMEDAACEAEREAYELNLTPNLPAVEMPTPLLEEMIEAARALTQGHPASAESAGAPDKTGNEA